MTPELVVCSFAEPRYGWKVRRISAPLGTWGGAELFRSTAERAGMVAWVARADDKDHVEISLNEEGVRMAEKRIYVVEMKNEDGDALNGIPDTTVKKLVRAGNPAQAIRHVAQSRFSAHVAKQEELVSLAAGGVSDAGDAA